MDASVSCTASPSLDRTSANLTISRPTHKRILAAGRQTLMA